MQDTIPNTYSKKLLEAAYKRYRVLKKDETYKQCYKSFKGLLWLRKNLLTNDAEREPLESAITVLSKNTLKKWGLNFLVSPYLKIKQADLHKPTINISSSLIEFIYAFGISNDVALYLPQDKTNEHAYIYMALWRKQDRPKSRRVKEQDDIHARFICYLLVNQLRVNRRFVGRLLKISKDTVLNYVQEVNRWTQKERDTTMGELMIGAKVDTTVHDRPKAERLSYDKDNVKRQADIQSFSQQKDTGQESLKESDEPIEDSEGFSFDA